jgi:hypothetical protein
MWLDDGETMVRTAGAETATTHAVQVVWRPIMFPGATRAASFAVHIAVTAL